MIDEDALEFLADMAGGDARSALNAIELGVNRVFILDGTKPHAILMEMLTDEGVGTMFVKEE